VRLFLQTGRTSITIPWPKPAVPCVHFPFRASSADVAVIVISYARVDQKLVRGLVKLLRAALAGLDRAVFWDEDLEAGEPWFEQVAREIKSTGKLFVFWCSHSAVSAQVARELQLAFETNVAVVPVLLDDTALPDTLAPIHGIDMRDVGAEFSHFVKPPHSADDLLPLLRHSPAEAQYLFEPFAEAFARELFGDG
jgi:hypothetical protein